jgi:hypothetical protein
MSSSSRPRYVLFAVASVAIALTAVFFALHGPSDSPGGEDGDGALGQPLPPALSAAELERAERERAELQARGEDLHGHAVEPAAGLEVAGREFLRFYLPYEVGKARTPLAAGLRRTATPQFATELLENAPRFPPGLGRAPAEARLLDVEATPLDHVSGRIVAKLRRGRDLEAVAFELRLIAGHWLVSGVAG